MFTPEEFDVAFQRIWVNLSAENRVVRWPAFRRALVRQRMFPRDALMLRVRELSLSEGEALSRLVRRTKDVTVMKRAMVILHSHQGFSPPKIAQMVSWSEDWGPPGHQGLQPPGPRRPLPQEGARGPAYVHPGTPPSHRRPGARKPPRPRDAHPDVEPGTPSRHGNPRRDRGTHQQRAGPADPARGGHPLPGREDVEGVRRPQFQGEARQDRLASPSNLHLRGGWHPST